MSNPTHITFGITENLKAASKRKQQILAILERGNIAVFTAGALVKKVCEWKENDHGDLIAFESNGKVKELCWESSAYTITEEEKNPIKP